MLKSRRAFLEPLRENADGYYRLSVNQGVVELKLNDCNRTISWYFGRPGEKRAVAKIGVLKALVDDIHAYLTGAEA